MARFVVETRAERIPDAVRHEAKRALLNFLATGIRGGHRSDLRNAAALAADGGAGHGDDRRPQRARRRAQRHVPQRRRRQRRRFLRHPSADRDPSDRAGHAGALRAVRAAARARRRSAQRLRDRRRGRVPDRQFDLAVALPDAGLAHHRELRRVRRGGRRRPAARARCAADGLGAGLRRDAILAAWWKCWACRPRASASATRRATACGRRCWRSAASKARRVRSKAASASSTRWARRRNCPALLDGLGETWELSINAYKPYPGGVVIHPVIDCRAGSARQGRVQDRGHRPHRWCTAIRCSASAPTGPTSPPAARRRSACSTASPRRRFSATPGSTNTPTPACNDPAVLELRRKVEVVQDAKIPVEAAVVELWTKDGKHHRAAVDAARGSAGRPLTDRELEQKFETPGRCRASRTAAS